MGKTTMIRPSILPPLFTFAALLFALLSLPSLPSQLTTSEIRVKVVAVDRDSRTVTLLCPMVHTVEIVAEVEHGDEYVTLREGEFMKAELVPGKMNTTRRSMIVVDAGGEEKIEMKIQRVVLK